jgi:hypothetical protein
MRSPIDRHRFFIGIDPNQSTITPPEADWLPCNRPGGGGDPKMLDTVMVVAGVAFFMLAIAYVAACDRM